MTKKEVYEYFNEMMLLKDKEKAWSFDELDFTTLTEDEQTELYIQLFNETWHKNHENIALNFQVIRNPLATDILYQVAMKYDIEEFECKPLSRKCTWALADIGTEKSKEYLEKLAICGDNVVEGFAQKRLDHWENELNRKGQRIRHKGNYDVFIRLENYKESLKNIPQTGQQIIGNEFVHSQSFVTKSETYVVLYQAYKKSIADFSVENQILGGQEFSYNRMSWIKPNFLWMMFRCGWATKENQERVLALWITKKDFIEILNEATFTSYNPKYFSSEEEWKKELAIKKVRLQWDPDHHPKGNTLNRRAIQLGLKGEVLEKFGKNHIKYIMDITDFVKEQKHHLDNNNLDKLLVPIERIIEVDNQQLANKIGIQTSN